MKRPGSMLGAALRSALANDSLDARDRILGRGFWQPIPCASSRTTPIVVLLEAHASRARRL
ncbi:MAG TPA: hypothetical protein VL400_20010 [Polyangiaceae bacterium]|jgi:hypothetical protein|nr:hypothetical protein [Polyangiaceae bacterium]